MRGQGTCDIQGRFQPEATASAGESESERRGEAALCGCVLLLPPPVSGPTTVDADPDCDVDEPV